MNKLAVKAVAKLAHVNVQEATTVVRKNPVLGDEIHIEEELINLEESIKTYYLAAKTLENYPDIKKHVISEKRMILKHCIGLVVRMMQGRAAPRPYTSEDINRAVRQLVRLVVKDAQRANIRIDDEIVEVVQPLLNLRQRYALTDKPWDSLHFGAVGNIFGRVLPSRLRA